MRSRTFLKICGSFTLLALCIIAVLMFTAQKAEAPTQVGPTETDVLALLSDKLSRGCVRAGVEESYQSCILTIEKSGESSTVTVTVTYDGLSDDSVRASRIQTIVKMEGGEWIRGAVEETQQCQSSRGHQDFSKELCI